MALIWTSFRPIWLIDHPLRHNSSSRLTPSPNNPFSLPIGLQVKQLMFTEWALQKSAASQPESTSEHPLNEVIKDLKAKKLMKTSWRCKLCDLKFPSKDKGVVLSHIATCHTDVQFDFSDIGQLNAWLRWTSRGHFRLSSQTDASWVLNLHLEALYLALSSRTHDTLGVSSRDGCERD